MRFALDSCILIDCQDPKEDTISKLSHLIGTGHEIIAPLTVIGEVIHVCLEKRLDVNDFVVNLQKLNLRIIFPAPELRDWCRLVDEANDIGNNWGSSVTDRTHLAYAITHGANYFVTSHSEVKNLHVPHDAAAMIEVIDMDQVKAMMRKR